MENGKSCATDHAHSTLKRAVRSVVETLEMRQMLSGDGEAYPEEWVYLTVEEGSDGEEVGGEKEVVGGEVVDGEEVIYYTMADGDPDEVTEVVDHGDIVVTDENPDDDIIYMTTVDGE